MTAYLQAWDLWEAVAEDLEIDQLSENPTMQIMNLETAFHIWQYLKTKFQGNARTKSMRILNIRRELKGEECLWPIQGAHYPFPQSMWDLTKMKDFETVKEYVDRLLDIINKLRLLGEKIPDGKIVEKILVTLPERLEAKISALEEVHDLTKIFLAELLNALHAQEQRRQIGEDGSIESAMQAKLQLKDSWKNKKKKGKEEQRQSSCSNNGATSNKGRNYHPCQHCGRTNHPYFRCWNRPDAKCNTCNQMGHIDKICKNKGNQVVNEAQAVNQEEEE
ncbi:hypothetical protein MANES_01G044850v8 [Manihot esculenta]|uniref:Uncharacterized protein n=1 Tax=Manihot esculenta TaxID=3983 RepID=A0ACB7ID82_MANES|nr:hypothetical protein MANES_01G044850v8 [Manihot esculenta]